MESNCSLKSDLSDKDVKKLFVSYKTASDSLKENIKIIYENIKAGDNIKASTCLHNIMALKKYNREILLEINKRRQRTDKKRLLVDKTHIDLQNILYEIENLQSEIDSCLQFQSSHETMDIVTIEEIKDLLSDEDLSNEVKMTMKRLDWEHQERIRLDSDVTRIDKEVKEVFNDLLKKRDFLDSLGPKLKDIIDSTSDLQTIMNIPFSEANDQYALSFHLPSPLQKIYTLFASYANETASSDLEELGYVGVLSNNSRLFTLNIEGSIEEAKSYIDPMKKQMETRPEDTEQEPMQVEEKDTYHPLRLILTINNLSRVLNEDELNNLKFTLKFAYKANKGVITTICSLETINETFNRILELEKHPTFGHLISMDNILDYLKIFENEPISSYLNKTDYTEKVYPWSHRLAGIPVMLETKSIDLEKDVELTPNSTCIGNLIENIAERILTRIHLTKELIQIEKETSTYNDKSSTDSLDFETAAWESLTVEQILRNDRANFLYKNGSLLDDDLAFSASLIIRPKKESLSLIIIVPVDYPRRKSLILINPYDQEELSSLMPYEVIRPLIREIELNVNFQSLTLTSTKTTDKIISEQITRINELIHKLLHNDGPDLTQTNAEFYRRGIMMK